MARSQQLPHCRSPPPWKHYTPFYRQLFQAGKSQRPAHEVLMSVYAPVGLEWGRGVVGVAAEFQITGLIWEAFDCCHPWASVETGRKGALKWSVPRTITKLLAKHTCESEIIVHVWLHQRENIQQSVQWGPYKSWPPSECPKCLVYLNGSHAKHLQYILQMCLLTKKKKYIKEFQFFYGQSN